MNAFETITAAVHARLNQAPTLAVQIERARRRPLEEGVDSAINVYFGGSVPSRGTIRQAPVDWTTTIRFECLKRGTSSQSADQAALALHAVAWERLLSEPTLGGLAMDMEPGPVDGDEDEFDTPAGCVIGSVTILHRTSSNTLEPVT